MDKVTLLTVSRVDRQVAAMAPVSNILSQATPAFILDERFQKAISALTVTLYFQTRFLAATTLYASRILAVQAYFATTFGATMSRKLLAGIWDSAAVQRLRKKMFEDFAKWILGSGNTIFCALFWPGWWVIGCAVLAVAQFGG
ncbi:unnamed protein product [Clonostachys chloroleuca]|uniref:Uncharacterized protein n=1 Tax=Clonostachys chloroleuca TaxID=1926264 RepID=A0AA35LZW4_9HYPO|nr:unnamed protein product [Clonostachys chloroleuca]